MHVCVCGGGGGGIAHSFLSSTDHQDKKMPSHAGAR